MLTSVSIPPLLWRLLFFGHPMSLYFQHGWSCVDNKLIDVKATLVADANEKLPFTFTVENATFGEPTLLDPTVVTLDVPGVRNSEVDVGVNDGATIVKMKYNRLHLDVLFANTDQPFPYSGDPNLTSYLPLLNSVVFANIQPDDIQGGQLVTTDNVNYTATLTAADNSLGYFGQTALTFRLTNSTPSWEGDPNNMLTWWPLDWVVPIDAEDFGANQPTYVAWESGLRTRVDSDHPGDLIPIEKYVDKLTVGAGYRVPYLMRVGLGDPIRPGVGQVTGGQTYVEVTVSVDSALFEENISADTEVAFYWLAAGRNHYVFDEVSNDWVIDYTEGPSELTLFSDLHIVDRADVDQDGKINLTVRLDFPTDFVLRENFFAEHGHSHPDVEIAMNDGTEAVLNGTGSFGAANAPGLSLRMVHRSTDPSSTMQWTHNSNNIYGPLFTVRINERPGFNIVD